MAIDCIHSIELTTNNSEVFSVTSDDINKFYIASIDENGDEKSFSKKNDSLQANFFLIRINNEEPYNEIIKRLYEQKDIVKIELLFTNGNSQEIYLPKKRE